jgi:predicted DNA binding CopG/RHH family protein
VIPSCSRGSKPTSQPISLRLPEATLEHLKMLANKRDVPYQSLLKVFSLAAIAGLLAITAG